MPQRRDARARERAPITRPGETCWRRERSGRVGFLIDGDAYYRALRSAIIQTQRSLLVLGWELNSRVPLVPDHPADEWLPDGWPNRFNDLLAELVRRRKDVHVHILLWDFAMIYLLEREVMPIFRPPWNGKSRIHFRMDGNHPLGGSHHQKIVVVDDRLAFSGGLDITTCRWDTPEHRAEDPRRCKVNGESYGPFHDVQMVVDGPAAAALGELARARWKRATGQKLAPAAKQGHRWRGKLARVRRARARPPSDLSEAAPWPEGVEPDLTDIDVAIARTEPAYGGSAEVREVERLYLEALAAAENLVYIENQYVTSSRLGDVIAESLAREGGPEIVIVTSQKLAGWLEETAMGVARTRLLRRLRVVDKHGRLAVYYPVVPNLDSAWRLTVHSKVMVVDERLARIGSANLANRSMGLDTECDLAIEADGRPETAAAIRGLRDRLLAEHLGCSVDAVAEAIERNGSLIETIEELGGKEHRLEPLYTESPEVLTQIVPDNGVLDPERPIDLDLLASRLLFGNAEPASAEAEPEPPEHEPGSAPGRGVLHLWPLAAALLTVAGLTVAWSLSPLAELVDLQGFLAWTEAWRASAGAPYLMIGAFVLGGLIAFPVTLLISVSGILFGPLWGFLYAMIGSLIGAGLGFVLGQVLGRDAVRRLGGRYVNRISWRLGQRGMLAVALLRLVPVAPFTLINVIAGATHIRLRDFLVGTLLGMAPGAFALTVFGDRLVRVLSEPGPIGWAALLGAAAGVLAVSWAAFAWSRRRLGNHAEERARDAG